MLNLGAFDVLSVLEDSGLLCLDWWSGGSVIAFKFESLSLRWENNMDRYERPIVFQKSLLLVSAGEC